MWITNEELKDYIQVDFGTKDMTNWILQAQSIIENYLLLNNGVNLEATEIVEFFDGGKYSFVLNHYPVSEIKYVKIDGEEVSVENYKIFNDGILILENGTPEGKRNIEVKYIAGYTKIPDDIKRACALIVQKLIAISQRGIDMPNSQGMGGLNIAWQNLEILDGDIKIILDKYRRYYVL